LLSHFDVDFRYIAGPRYVGPEPVVHPDGSVEDHFGVPRVRVSVGAGEKAGTYMEAVNYPLPARCRSRTSALIPSGRAPTGLIMRRCASRWPRHGLQEGRGVHGDRLNRCAQLKPGMYLRGVEQILLDLVEKPEIAEYIFRRLTEFYLEYARRTFEAAAAGLDVFMTGDDFGTQRGLFMSPDMWRRFLRPGFEAFVQLGKRYGCKVAHHSCGSIQPIIPDLIECGLDILNPIQRRPATCLAPNSSGASASGCPFTDRSRSSARCRLARARKSVPKSGPLRNARSGRRLHLLHGA